jgi:hypothetical protein
MLAALLLATVQAQTCLIEHLALEMPPSYCCEEKRGPDFSVFYVHLSDKTSDSSIGFYLGDHPTSFAPKEGTSSERLTLGHRRGHWLLWVEHHAGAPDEFMAEARLERPFGTEPEYSTYLHIFVSAQTAAERKILQELALTVHPRNARE